MEDSNSAAGKRTGADRQRDFAERQKAAGYKRTTVWIHEETAKEGIRAARAGKPLEPMESKDPLSWAAGWISEKGKQ
ncbi:MULTISPECIES: hypothetical protein [Pseudomonas]|uniref:hypothetical protein n=1 Tax=Pseudomonas TaxID=286 RepID=UPI0024B89923|nr:hypothetical protein [Pseudomonas sp. G2-4]WHS59050.1 hypothetical protein QNH97_21730 [Pseudomonas sp. G2-4]